MMIVRRWIPALSTSSSATMGRAMAWLLTLLVLATVAPLFVRDWQRTRPAQLRLRAYLPENGGWTGQPLRVESGRQVALQVQGMEGAHTLAIAHTDVHSGQILPGSQTAVSFTAPAPGRYVVYCTTWCSPNHWRMRTVLEVVDPEHPDAPLSYVQDEQRYQIPLDSMGLDEPHPASTWPAQRPSIAAGEVVWQRLGPDVSPTGILDQLGWPMVTPAQVFEQITNEDVPALAGSADLSEQEQWTLVAYLWRQHTTPDTLALGARLYAENCAACHGPEGKGDGFAAASSSGIEPDFTAAPTAAGAAPALYYAKIARGGMGTGMPNWGTVLSEDELWALAAYLHSFMFDYGTLSKATAQGP